ncbi:MAG: energy transducer TonB, partial [Alphaproteobacteria bacterium]
FAVETDGRVGDVEVISATSACFAEAAKSEIVRWRYRPKVVNGEPVRSERMRVKLVFVEKR